MKLPEYVEPCFMCKGEGEYKQTYNYGCGSGYFPSMGKCDVCDGYRFLYRSNLPHRDRRIGASVLNQISIMNGAEVARVLF